MATSAVDEALVASLLKGDSVFLAEGVLFDFASGAMAVWNGMRPLDATAFGGPVFQPLANMGAIGELELGSSPATQSLTFHLSAVKDGALDSSMITLSLDQSEEVKGRDCRIFSLLFDAAEALVACEIERTAIMDMLTVEASMETNPPTGIISLTAEPILADRNKTPLAFLSDIDQRTRYPGPPADRGLERGVYLTRALTLKWG